MLLTLKVFASWISINIKVTNFPSNTTKVKANCTAVSLHKYFQFQILVTMANVLEQGEGEPKTPEISDFLPENHSHGSIHSIVCWGKPLLGTKPHTIEIL